ncbi:MAG: DNA-protecting protein DprA [Actinobacteria bacterium]|uniref:Unannotated protein n=1 Tax=freshwater metagenome TaxID=449393 RepID=A0A6J5ZER0_9ZZZZ|nr:DNA-protecting protein DprA [Actinomycetota bacterium]
MAGLTTAKEIRAAISLCAVPGSERIGRSLAEFGEEHTLDLLMRGIGPKKVINDIRQATLRVQQVLDSPHYRFITPQDLEWPALLRDLDCDQPVGLWCRGQGNLADLSVKQIAIVGARAATSYGERMASAIASNCVQWAGSVISGGAFGIDAAAHRGALSSDGATVAVLASGVDVAYPSAHTGLFDRIVESGLVISEAPPGTKAAKHAFLIRNRLIAALSQATVVVEAALRSGSLSTANWANALGRPVWGVPGPLTSASSAGVHAGIRDGTMCIVADENDVLDSILG